MEFTHFFRKKFQKKGEMQKENEPSGTIHISSGDPKVDEARAKLMASIREMGGKSKAGLKTVEDHDKFYRE